MEIGADFSSNKSFRMPTQPGQSELSFQQLLDKHVTNKAHLYVPQTEMAYQSKLRTRRQQSLDVVEEDEEAEIEADIRRIKGRLERTIRQLIDIERQLFGV
ncbi:MAG: hypothetical protein CL521_06085 [Actinobacteria bacterium]|nr:hypothetical protein [Actinomycetota bacterium]|tara:strand:+ start:115 stop:417 length:303 start_codon:yes stop_codon:yes gene_type:complete